MLSVDEQDTFEVGEGGMSDLGVGRWKLLHSVAGEGGEVIRGASEGGERRPAGFVGQRDVDVGAAGKCLEQRARR